MNYLFTLMRDGVTGFHEARSGTARSDTLNRARRFIETSGYPGAYLEIEIRKSGGLNASLGHSRAHRVYGEIAGIIQDQLQKLDADVSLFRHGSGEMSAVVVGVNAAGVAAAMQRARNRAGQFVRTERDRNGRPLSEIPDPKYPDDPTRKGTGFTFAAQDIRPHADYADIISVVRQDLEVRRRQGPF